MRLWRLGSRGEVSLTKNFIEDTPRYAILSHTWGADDDEVTFNDLGNGSGKSKASYAKIQFCGKQASKDGLQYFWVDTCCIDKANNTEPGYIVRRSPFRHTVAKSLFRHILGALSDTPFLGAPSDTPFLGAISGTPFLGALSGTPS